MSGILDGKRILVTGVLTEGSIAFHAAKVAQEQGAEVVLTGFGRVTLVERIAKRLPKPTTVIEMDVTDQEHLDSLAAKVNEYFGDDEGIDGIVHSIAFGPQGAFNFLEASWEDVSTALQVSAYSLKSLTTALLPLMEKRGGGSVVGITFDGSIAWPKYDWMGVAKAALESTGRYLARDLGGRNVRVNMVSAGPIKSMAAKSIPGFEELADVWNHRAPIGWDLTDPEPAGRGVVGLLSDFFPKTTGEVVHVDGGVHMMGA